MNRRMFLCHGAVLSAGLLTGCRSNQFAKVKSPSEASMVGSHAAGIETYKPLVEETTAELLGRHGRPVVPVGVLPPPPLRICFVAVENKGAEEMGDFKEQIYQVIDTKIVQSGVFTPINKHFVDAGLTQVRMRPSELFVPQNMRTFAAVMEQQGQPFDALLYATVTTGTTRENKDSQRDYMLTLEMIDVQTGQYDKQVATLSKGYYHSRPSKWLSFTSLKN